METVLRRGLGYVEFKMPVRILSQDVGSGFCYKTEVCQKYWLASEFVRFGKT